MKFKNLLNLTLLMSLGISAQAQTQIFKEDFSAQQTKAETELGWYEFINTQEGDERAVADGVCKFVNTPDITCDGQGWQRAIKFRNLKLEEGKVYRLSFECWAESATYGDGVNTVVRGGLLQGGENCDIAIMTGKKDEGQQYVSWSPVSVDANHKYSSYIYFHSSQNQYDVYNARANKTKDLEETYFAAINIINPGTFTLDNVVLEEVGTISDICPVKEMIYGRSVIRTNFLYNTNIADLAKADPRGIVEVPAEAIKLKVNGTEEEIIAAELHADGCLYIFREPADDETITSMTVSFTNAAGDNQICWKDDAEGAIASFEDVAAVYDEDFELSEDEIQPWIYTAPKVVSTTPLDGSFALDETISEFTFNFDKEITTVDSYVDGDYKDGVAPKATLKGSGVNEVLAIKEGTEETATSITYVRTSTTALPKGLYTVIIEGLSSAIGIPSDYNVELSFEVGRPKLAETVYEDLTSVWVEGNYDEAQPTNGWDTYFNDALGTSNANRVGNMVTNGRGVGFYFCQRDASVPAKMVYGEKEGYSLTFPAGNIQLDLYLTQWQAKGGTADYAIYKKGDMENAIVSGTAIAATNTGGFGANVTDMTVHSIKIENIEAGDYVLVLKQNGGWEGTIIYGFDAKKYTVTEGEKNETEVIADGTFSNVNNNYMPAYGSGWRIHRDGAIRDPGTFASWSGEAGSDSHGGGGPRIFNLSWKDMAGKGCYMNSASSILTYGEFLTYTDAENQEQEEKTLDLKVGKYKISYNAGLWKAASNGTIVLNIYRQADGITGDPVATFTTKITTPSAGENTGATIETTREEITWKCQEDDKYILAFHSEGCEAMLGNIKLETTGSLAVEFMEKLNAALATAKNEAEIANDNDNYKGTTREALNNAITEYTNPDYHTAQEYNDAIADLKQIVNKMAARRDNIDAYPTCLEGVLAGLEAAKGTKYENLPQYPIVEDAYNKYKDVDYVAMNDEDLSAAVTAMGNNGALLKNMVEYCVPEILTKQISQLVKAIQNLEPKEDSESGTEGGEAAAKALNSDSENSVILAAANAISDDQELVSQLKTIFVAKVYDMIANDKNPFETFDPELEISDIDPEKADLSFLIQNADFYSSAKAVETNCPATVDDFPGWNIEVIKGSIASMWTTAWGGKWPTDVKPYEDCALKAPYGSHEFDAHQIVTKLPVLKYNVSFVLGRDDQDNEPYPYAYCGDTQVESHATSRDNSEPSVIENVTPEISNNYGSLKIGAHMITGTHAGFDKARLTYVSKDDTFDYAAAAKALNEEIALSVEKVKTEAVGEPVAVEYYDLSGKKVTSPRGVAIKIAKYANGFTVVSKIVKK